MRASCRLPRTLDPGAQTYMSGCRWRAVGIRKGDTKLKLSLFDLMNPGVISQLAAETQYSSSGSIEGASSMSLPLPGVPKEDVSVRRSGRHLRVSVDPSSGSAYAGLTRDVLLPSWVGDVSASMKDGMLSLSLTPREEIEPVEVPVS